MKMWEEVVQKNRHTRQEVVDFRSGLGMRPPAGNSLPGKRKVKKNSEQKNTTVKSRMRIAKNSNFCSTSHCRAVPIESMKTKMLDAAGFLVISKGKFSILCGHRLDDKSLQAL